MPKRKSFEEVRKAFEDKGYVLLSDTYENNKQKLRYRCPKHDNLDQFIRLNDLLNGHGCGVCFKKERVLRLKNLAKEQIKHIEDVKRLFDEIGYRMVEKSYKGSRYPIQFICPNHPHEIQSVRFNDLKRGGKCRFCAIDNLRLSIEEVKSIFESKGYALIDREYKNNCTPMRYTCPNHPDKELYITVDSLRGGHGCYFCGVDAISGENHYKYNHELPTADRISDRRYDPKEREWRSSVFKRDNFTCQVCGDKTSGNKNAHHKDGFNWCVDRRYDVDNGVTLCKKCHLEFHSIYGSGGNTEQQFIEWVAYRTGGKR